MTVGAGTDAFSVTGTSLALARDISSEHCANHLTSSWEVCNTDIASSEGCVRLDIPCPSSFSSFAFNANAEEGIACSDNIASQAPISFPTSTTVDVLMTFDDGVTRALEHPPPNSGVLTVAVNDPASPCEIVYDGTSAPVLQTKATGCGPALCTVSVQYSSPCNPQAINATFDLHVVEAAFLQPELACPDAATFIFPDPTVVPTFVATSSDLRQLSCGAAEFQQRTIWVAAYLTEQTSKPFGANATDSSCSVFMPNVGTPRVRVPRSDLLCCAHCELPPPVSAGSFFDVTDAVTLTASNAVIDLRSNYFDAALQNLVFPLALGAATIDSTLLTESATTSVTVAGTTFISSIELLEDTFTSDDVDSSDPSFSLCPSTFRGVPGDETPPLARFLYSDDDGLECPFDLALSTTPSAVAPLHDPATLVPPSQIVSSDTAAVSIAASGDLTLVQSSKAVLEISAAVDVACIAPASAGVSSTLQLHANLEAVGFQFDLGHRCGSPIGRITAGAQRPLADGDIELVPLRFAVPVDNSMSTVTVAVDFDDAMFAVNSSNIEPVLSSLGSFFAVNADDTNAVRLNSVWGTPTQLQNATFSPAVVPDTVLVTVLNIEFEVRRAAPAPQGSGLIVSLLSIGLKTAPEAMAACAGGRTRGHTVQHSTRGSETR